MDQLFTMENDMCLVVDEKNQIIDIKSKYECHLNKSISAGMIHRAFSVFLFSQDGDKLLLQQRSSEKLTFPLLYSNTCCSHPLKNYQETEITDIITAAKRRMHEELGIPKTKLESLRYKDVCQKIYISESCFKFGEHELDHIVLSKIPFDESELELNPNLNEIREIMWVTKDQLKDFYESNALTPWVKKVYSELTELWWGMKEDKLAQVPNVISDLRK